MKKIILAVLLVSVAATTLFAQEFLKGVKAENLKVEKYDTNILGQDTAGYGEDRRGGADFKFFYLDNYKAIDPELMRQINDPRGFMYVVSPQKDKVTYKKQEALEGKFWRGRQLYGNKKIWIYDFKSKSKKLLSPIANCVDHRWSPNGKMVAFTAGSGRRNSLYVTNVETSQTIILDSLPNAALSGDFGIESFDFSPDSKMIVYVLPLVIERGEPEDVIKKSEVFAINVDGTGKTQLTNTKDIEIYTKWLPDGGRLLVGRKKAGVPIILQLRREK